MRIKRAYSWEQMNIPVRMENVSKGIAYDPWSWHRYIYLSLAVAPREIISALKYFKKRIARGGGKGFRAIIFRGQA